MHKHQAYSLCRQYMHQHVRLTTKDGRLYEGFIENVDQDHVYLAIPRDSSFRAKKNSHRDGDRQIGFGYPGYGFPGGFGYEYAYPSYGLGYPSYGYEGFYPRRRFRRLAIPLAFLGGIALSRLFY